MPRKNKQQKRENKRKALRKRQRAQKSSKPKLFRMEPSLQDALNCRHPLLECLISDGWEESKYASIFIIRDAPTGPVLSSFSVDIAGLGLKDAWGNYALSNSDIEGMVSRAAKNNVYLVPCELSLAEKLIHSAIEWNKKWRFKLPKEYKIWLRILKPANETDIDLEMFGENGKPLLVLDEDDIHDVYEAIFDPKILGGNISVEENGIPEDMLLRIGDIKAALINFSRSSEFKHDFTAAMQDQFGSTNRPESEEEWITFQDRFILEDKLESGETVVEKFVNHHEKVMSEDVRQLLLGWQFVIEGLYEVEDIKNSGILMKNLINEKEYHVFPTASMDKMNVNPGDFMYARITPVKSFWIFSGGMSIFSTDGSDHFKQGMYKTAVQFQMKSPKMAFKDNEEKLQISRESVRKQYDDFVAHFESDEVADTGKQIEQKYNYFFRHLYFDKKDPVSGLSLAERYEKDNGRPYRPPKMKLPREVRKSKDVGMLCDLDEGVSLLIDYRRFIDIFEHPETGLYESDDGDIVMGYLVSESISDVPFRRIAQKYPENFRKVMSDLGGQEGFSYVDIEELMREFKPRSFNKLPTTVSILDPELSRVAHSLREDPIDDF